MSAALGAWLALGAVAVAPGATTASRVGILPPWWVLGALAVAFLALVFGLRMSRDRTVPLFGALACALPWVPGDVPAALLAWQGVMAGLVWTGIAVAVVAAKPLRSSPGVAGVLTDPSRAPWLAALCAAALFVAFWRGPAPWLPGGDEPHYLVITQSLLLDGDLKIENNHRRGDHVSYFPGQLKPDYLRRGVDREIYSIHAPGISTLVLPAFAAAGYRGAVLFIVLGCALGTALAWRLGWEVTGHAGAAWMGWASLVGAAPIVAHAYTIYPDGLSGVLVLVGFFAFLRARAVKSWPLVVGGVALAALPWMHTRNAIIAAALGLAIVLRVGAVPRRLAAFIAVPALSAAAWLAFFESIYGVFDPSVPYGGYTQSSLQNVMRGLPGLLCDQQFGAITTAPILLAGAVGTLVLLGGRRDDAEAISAPSALASVTRAREIPCSWRALGAAMVGVFVPYLLVVASYHMWWGGTSAPARFLVPVLWMAPLGVAAAWANGRTPSARAGWLVLLVLSAVQLALMSFGGSGLLTFTTRAPYGPLQEWATRAVDLSNALPSLIRDGPAVAIAQAMVWLLAWAGWWLAMRLAAATRARVSALAVPFAVLAISVALAAVWTARGVEPLRIDASRAGALGTVWDHGVGVAFARAEVDGRRVRSGVRAVEDVLPLLEVGPVARSSPPRGRIAALAALPAGVYRVRIASTEARGGRVRVEAGRGGAIREVELGELPVGRDGRAYFDLSLPVDIESLSVYASEAATASSCTLSPLWLASRGDRPLRAPALLGRRYGDVEVFFTTDGQYPEPTGIWVKAGGDVPLVVQAPASTTALRARVRNGPKPNSVELSGDAWQQVLQLSPNQEVDVEWPWSGSADWPVPQATDSRPRDKYEARVLRVRASTAFRPIDFEPATQDPRRLGAWIEFQGQ